ncbi:acetyltransferase [Luteimicrobium sp. DT211]|uniref:acetyltransferase n=1 Tax=Luteimicrobium sp. DT211 TaxID=3393412 RepID=UPI003CEFE3F0
MLEPKLIVPASSPEARAAIARGARVVARSWGAGLDADTVDLRRLERLLRAVDVAAIRELTADDLPAILRLDDATGADYPGDVATTHRPLTPETATPTPERRAFGAKVDAELVAMTFVDVDGDLAETDFTVVAAAWRARGLSTAVKALSVSALVRAGVMRLRTGGSFDNPAIMAANDRLGYVRDEEWLTLSV